jgi:hypothetical protein
MHFMIGEKVRLSLRKPGSLQCTKLRTSYLKKNHTGKTTTDEAFVTRRLVCDLVSLVISFLAVAIVGEFWPNAASCVNESLRPFC